MKKVLIIEDNDDIREGIVEMLEIASYETIAANNGKIGVELAIKNLPDIILCDIMMPELDGYGVLYLLQKNQQTANIPFIFMTAKVERSDMRKGMEMGADDYITKPFDDVELFNAIESRFRKKDKSQGFILTDGNKETFIEILKAKGKARVFANKQIIYLEKDQPDYLFYVQKGRVKTYMRAKDGRELSASLFQPGDFFGYESICNSTLYMDNAATIADSELLLISKADFLDILFKHQEVAHVFMSLLSAHVQEKTEQMLHLAYFSVRKRVADALVKVTNTFNNGELDNQTLRISRDDLAALVGTASETISRVLADFKDENLIEKKGNAIHILSIDKLKNIKQ